MQGHNVPSFFLTKKFLWWRTRKRDALQPLRPGEVVESAVRQWRARVQFDAAVIGMMREQGEGALLIQDFPQVVVDVQDSCKVQQGVSRYLAAPAAGENRDSTSGRLRSNWSRNQWSSQSEGCEETSTVDWESLKMTGSKRAECSPNGYQIRAGWVGWSGVLHETERGRLGRAPSWARILLETEVLHVSPDSQESSAPDSTSKERGNVFCAHNKIPGRVTRKIDGQEETTLTRTPVHPDIPTLLAAANIRRHNSPPGRSTNMPQKRDTGVSRWWTTARNPAAWGEDRGTLKRRPVTTHWRPQRTGMWGPLPARTPPC